MIRIGLLVLGVGLLGYGMAAWNGLVGPHPAPPTTTIQEVAQGRFRDREAFRLADVAADLGRKLAVDQYSDTKGSRRTLAPVQGSDGRVFLAAERGGFPTGGPLIGSVERLSDFEARQLRPGEEPPPALYLLRDATENYERIWDANAQPFLYGGGVALALAALLQGLILVRGRQAAAEGKRWGGAAPGRCPFCDQDAAVLPGTLYASARRPAGYRRTRVSSTEVPCAACAACQRRLRALEWARVPFLAAFVATVFLVISLLMFGVVLTDGNVSGLTLLGLAVVLGAFYGCLLLIRRRIDRALGPRVGPELKAVLGIGGWWPVADTVRFVPAPR